MSINMFRLLLLIESIHSFFHSAAILAQVAPKALPYGSARRGTEGGLSCLISRLEGIARGSLASRSQGAPIQMALPVRKQDFAHGLRCSVRGDGGAVAWL